MKILLDYAFPIDIITPTPQASTSFLRQVCVVAKPKSGQEGNVGNVYECTTMTQVAARTDNAEAQQLFNAGMTKVYILLSDDLDIADALEDNAGEFHTVLASSDYDEEDVIGVKATGTVTITSYANLVDAGNDEITVGGVTFVASSSAVTPGDATFRAATSDEATATSLAAQINAHEDLEGVVTAVADEDEVIITAVVPGTAGNSIALTYSDEGTATVGATVTGTGTLTGGLATTFDLGAFAGVFGVSSADLEFLEDQAAIANRCAFFTKSENGAKNMLYAFGSLLSATNWSNQQYISMPFNDDVETLGEANSLFDDKISFVIHDDEFSNRLALFAVGAKAIIAPYIIKNLSVDMQSRALQYLTANQPQYTLKEATLLETRLQEDVINSYISRNQIESGSIEISLVEQNFVANGEIEVSEPKALWRVFNEMTQTV